MWCLTFSFGTLCSIFQLHSVLTQLAVEARQAKENRFYAIIKLPLNLRFELGKKDELIACVVLAPFFFFIVI